jgi:hypothetical protein
MITRVALNGIQYSYASNDTVKWGFRLSRDTTCAANFIYIYIHTRAPNCLVSWLAVSEITIVKRQKNFLTPVFFLLLRVFWSFYYDFLIYFFNYQIASQSTWPRMSEICLNGYLTWWIKGRKLNIVKDNLNPDWN